MSKFINDSLKKVLLIHGGPGAGKSLFCNIFVRKLIKDKPESVPIFISLPQMKDPIGSLLDETL